MDIKNKKIGYIGLGKMGFGMVELMLEKGYKVVATNRSSEPIDKIAEKGAEPVYNYSELLEKLDEGPRVLWLMVPWKAVDDVLSEFVDQLNEGDIVIDGGNSPYTETVRRHEELSEKGIKFMDVGVSGGPSGARNGACMMIGGEEEIFQNLEPLFKDLSVVDGYGHMGKAGAGHFVKMVHNGIEYGMMQAIAEGFEVMKKSEFQINLPEVTKVYNHGSVIESRLVGWLESAYQQYGPDLTDISGEVSHSGEGQWTVEAAQRLGVPVENIKQSLQFRIDSQGNPSYTGKVVSALRNQFGGHDVSKNDS
jgi:6-phosphogluconate dehydrogenase